MKDLHPIEKKILEKWFSKNYTAVQVYKIDSEFKYFKGRVERGILEMNEGLSDSPSFRMRTPEELVQWARNK